MVRKFVVVAFAFWIGGCAKPDTPFSAMVDGGPGHPDGGGVDQGHDGAGPACGDGTCNSSGGETCSTCPADCGACNTNCPMGFGDCDSNPANGCETNLNGTANCGGCGLKCDQIGGTNACVLVGANYVCKPSCDANHSDCDKNPNNGCEADITTVNNCGACGAKCMNPHGTASCTTMGAGYFCNAACDPGFSSCGPKPAGCTTQTGSDVDHCGDCSRPCSAANVATRNCGGGVCAPSCNAPYADCTRPLAPNADDGCETNGSLDPGENDNSCNGQSSSVNEGSTNTRTTNRILPTADTDTFTVNFSEATHFCLGSQSYSALITLIPADSTALSLGYNLNGCNNTWTSIGNSVCVSWGGTCGIDDSRTFSFQVSGIGGANSCSNYTLSTQFCNEGTKCPGCP